MKIILPIFICLTIATIFITKFVYNSNTTYATTEYTEKIIDESKDYHKVCIDGHVYFQSQNYVVLQVKRTGLPVRCWINKEK